MNNKSERMIIDPEQWMRHSLSSTFPDKIVYGNYNDNMKNVIEKGISWDYIDDDLEKIYHEFSVIIVDSSDVMYYRSIYYTPEDYGGIGYYSFTIYTK